MKSRSWTGLLPRERRRGRARTPPSSSGDRGVSLQRGGLATTSRRFRQVAHALHRRRALLDAMRTRRTTTTIVSASSPARAPTWNSLERSKDTLGRPRSAPIPTGHPLGRGTALAHLPHGLERPDLARVAPGIGGAVGDRRPLSLSRLPQSRRDGDRRARRQARGRAAPGGRRLEDRAHMVILDQSVLLAKIRPSSSDRVFGPDHKVKIYSVASRLRPLRTAWSLPHRSSGMRVSADVGLHARSRSRSFVGLTTTSVYGTARPMSTAAASHGRRRRAATRRGPSGTLASAPRVYDEPARSVLGLEPGPGSALFAPPRDSPSTAPRCRGTHRSCARRSPAARRCPPRARKRSRPGGPAVLAGSSAPPDGARCARYAGP